MIIDFIEKYNNEYPDDSIVCFMNFSKQDLISLLKGIDSLIHSGNDLHISDLNFVSDSKIHLLFKIDETDEGIVEIDRSKLLYHCILSKKAFIKIYELLNSYIESDMNGFQWLYDLNTNIDLLLSQNGKW